MQMKYKGRNREYFEVVEIDESNCEILKSLGSHELSLVWFTSDQNVLKIDSTEYNFQENDIISLTEFHQIEVIQVHTAKLLRFNRPFYCILDHDSEISCKGILYYGASTLPVIKPEPDQLEILVTVWKMLSIEMMTSDNLQLEMLQMMLKRMLILCARIYKDQINYSEVTVQNVDILREFNFLVEKHFREKHSVTDYAELLHKSPKTLSNLFKKIGDKTPLQYIKERIALEARRLLAKTTKSVSEIGYDLGFNDVQSFSRFFKNLEGCSPLDFRISQQEELLPTHRE